MVLLIRLLRLPLPVSGAEHADKRHQNSIKTAKSATHELHTHGCSLRLNLQQYSRIMRPNFYQASKPRKSHSNLKSCYQYGQNAANTVRKLLRRVKFC